MARGSGAALAALVLGAGAASGQTLLWTRRVDDGSANQKFEVSLAIDRRGTDVMAAWMHGVTGGPFSVINVHYNVAVDGEHFRTDPGAVPLPAGASARLGDPMAVFAGDG